MEERTSLHDGDMSFKSLVGMLLGPCALLSCKVQIILPISTQKLT